MQEEKVSNKKIEKIAQELAEILLLIIKEEKNKKYDNDIKK